MTKETLLLPVGDLQRDLPRLETAAAILRRGGLVALPTETVYGLGANALDPQAVASIFAAKGRPQDNPLIVHLSSPQEAQRYAQNIPQSYYRLCQRFSPGPLTVILEKRDCIPEATSGGLGTVALRIPAHPIAQALIRLAGVPLAAPSANLSGSPSPTTAQHCIQDLWGRVDAIVDGGECGVGLESTVVSLAGERPCLLRPGAVTPEELCQVLGQLDIHPAVEHRLREGQQAASPGMKYKHYAPSAKVIVLEGDTPRYAAYVNSRAAQGVWALCFDQDLPHLRVPCLSLGDNPAQQARRLFGALRELDQRQAQVVYAHCPSREGMGLAVYNRLIRAAAYDHRRLEG